jgi:hypothetical protein
LELTPRKKLILRAIVETYIATAEPVGSKAVAQFPGLTISTATIRNEMADLTELGLLEQPHTSAGRVPSPADRVTVRSIFLRITASRSKRSWRRGMSTPFTSG